MKNVAVASLLAVGVFFGLVFPGKIFAYTLNKLGDQNFQDFLSGATGRWSCIVMVVETGDQDFCVAEQHYTAAGERGVQFGKPDAQTIFGQIADSLDNTKDQPIVQLSFDYRLHQNGAEPGSATFSTALIASGELETNTLFTKSIDHTTQWKHKTIDLHDYAWGTPTIQFIMEAAAGSDATVSIRKVRLIVSSYATLQATFIDRDNLAINGGKVKIIRPASGLVVAKRAVADDGTVTMLSIPGSSHPYRLVLSHHDQPYTFRKRLRYGWDYIYTFRLRDDTLTLKPIEHEAYHQTNF